MKASEWRILTAATERKRKRTRERERDGAIVHECVCEKRKTRTGGE